MCFFSGKKAPLAAQVLEGVRGIRAVLKMPTRPLRLYLSYALHPLPNVSGEKKKKKKKKSLSNWQSQNRKERSSSGGRGQADKQAHNNGLLGDYNKFIIMDGTKSKQPEVCAWFNDSGAMHSGEL